MSWGREGVCLNAVGNSTDCQVVSLVKAGTLTGATWDIGLLGIRVETCHPPLDTQTQAHTQTHTHTHTRAREARDATSVHVIFSGPLTNSFLELFHLDKALAAVWAGSLLNQSNGLDSTSAHCSTHEKVEQSQTIHSEQGSVSANEE